jgi:heme-degrading monooxygenase HmoA
MQSLSVLILLILILWSESMPQLIERHRGIQMGRCAMPVTLINVFSVPKGKEDEFVKWWQDVKADITKQSGFISGKFHKSIKPESKFNFINVAIWENEDLYWKAYEKSAAPMKSKLDDMGAEMVLALYDVAFEY